MTDISNNEIQNLDTWRSTRMDDLKKIRVEAEKSGDFKVYVSGIDPVPEVREDDIFITSSASEDYWLEEIKVESNGNQKKTETQYRAVKRVTEHQIFGTKENYKVMIIMPHDLEDELVESLDHSFIGPVANRYETIHNVDTTGMKEISLEEYLKAIS